MSAAFSHPAPPPALHVLRAVLDAVPHGDNPRQDVNRNGDPLALYVALRRAACALAPLTNSFYIGFYDAANQRVRFEYNDDEGVFEKPEWQPLKGGPTTRVLRTGVPFHDGDADLTAAERRAIQDGGMPYGDAERLSASWLHLPLWAAPETPINREASPPPAEAQPRSAIAAPFGVMGILSYTPGAFADPVVRASLTWLAEYAARRFHEAEAARRLRAAELDRDALAIAHVDALDALAQTAARIARHAQTGGAPGQKTSREFRDGAASLAPLLGDWLHACYRAQTVARSTARLAPPPMSPTRLAEARRLFALLTPSERAVAERYADGLSQKEIADALSIAESTVKSHVTRIRQKLGSDNQARVARLLAPALDE